MIVLDILSTLVRSAKMTPKQLGSMLNSRPNRDTLRNYLKILVDLRLISIDSTDHRWVAKARKLFQAPERGMEFVSSTGRLLSLYLSDYAFLEYST